jgi:hypothetical protein
MKKLSSRRHKLNKLHPLAHNETNDKMVTIGIIDTLQIWQHLEQ